MLSHLSSVVAFAASLAVQNGAPAAPKKPAVITITGCGGAGRPLEELGRYARFVSAARPRLEACAEVAYTEDPDTRAEIDADLAVQPNGEVSGATVSSQGEVSEAGVACVRSALLTLSFDPPGTPGAVVRVAVIMGAPPAQARPPLPFRADVAFTNSTTHLVGPIPVRLAGRSPAPLSRASQATRAFVAKCASGSHPPASIVLDAHGLVTASGELARLEVEAPAAGVPAPLRACVAAPPVAPSLAARGRLVSMDLRLSVEPDGTVDVAP